MSKIDFDHSLGSQIGYAIVDNIELEKNLSIIKSLNPVLKQEGNQWCYAYGELPNDCILGFGDTPYEAMLDFCQNFFNQKSNGGKK